MSTKTVTTRIQLWNKTTSGWESKNPVLLKGEFGFDSDKKYIKIGDGVTAWNSLPSVRLPKECIDGFADENTRYDIREDVAGKQFTLLSSDGVNPWGDVRSFTCHDWTTDIATAKADAIGTAETAATAKALSAVGVAKAYTDELADDVGARIFDLDSRLSSVEDDYLKAEDKTELEALIANEADRAIEREDELSDMVGAEYSRAMLAEDLLDTRISAIEDKIPHQATSENKLADKEFVNSSIATSTASFQGTYGTIEEIEALSADANDYAFLSSVDSAGNTKFDRYKYSGALSIWAYEYTLNNSSFTANQWGTINSGATATDVAQITTNKNDIASLSGTVASTYLSSSVFTSWKNGDYASRQTTIDTEIAKKAASATTLSGYGIADAYTKTETGMQITNAINALDVAAITGTGAKTITSIAETNGKITATYSDIAITESQVSGLTADLAEAELVRTKMKNALSVITDDENADIITINNALRMLKAALS